VERSYFPSDISEQERLKQHFDAALIGIREEFDEHRESINDNTNEIQANYEYVCRVEQKIDALSEKLEHIQNWLSRTVGLPQYEDAQPVIELTEREKEVFMVVYTGSTEHPLSYIHVAEALGESEFLVKGLVTNMIEKGVPIRKQHFEGRVHLILDSRFRELQAKRNFLNIRQKTVQEFII
jgi:DNA-binding CsgD family transcriptional regulator